jgi:hypothetical protein
VVRLRAAPCECASTCLFWLFLLWRVSLVSTLLWFVACSRGQMWRVPLGLFLWICLGSLRMGWPGWVLGLDGLIPVSRVPGRSLLGASRACVSLVGPAGAFTRFAC